MEEYSHMVEMQDPAIKNYSGFVDGVRFKIQDPGDVELQNGYYNGWQACCNISNVVCFSPDGCIIWARYNCPGMMFICHDMLPHDMSYHGILIHMSYHALGSWHDAHIAPVQGNPMSAII